MKVIIILQDYTCCPEKQAGRIGIAAQMLGLAEGAFDASVPYTFSRKQFGQAIGTFQGMAFQFSEAATLIETARLMTYNAARRKDEGRTFAKEAAMAKYWASIVAQKVSGSAIEWVGGIGFTRETGIEKYWRDSKIVSLPVGSWDDSHVILPRVLFMKGLLTSNCKPLRNSSRSNIPRKLFCLVYENKALR
jgi:alkylation response protein AidB-like acyl-CoA dehydrogenase